MLSRKFIDTCCVSSSVLSKSGFLSSAFVLCSDECCVLQQEEVFSDDADEEVIHFPDQPLSPQTNRHQPSTARPGTASAKQNTPPLADQQPR